MSIVGKTYLERGEPVTVLVQWGLKSRGETYGGPRNVRIRRADGTEVVRPFRGASEDAVIAEQPWAEKTLEEKYAHERGSFNDQIDNFEIPGEPQLSIVVRRVCREKTVVPRWLGLDGPLSRASSKNFVVFARRLIWRAAYDLTDLSVENIAQLFGYSPSTVRPWATSWKLFEADDPIWWRFWGPANADLIGVPLEVARD